MKTVMISFYEAYPPRSGAATVSFNLAKHWPGNIQLFQLSFRTGQTLIAPRLIIRNIRYTSDNHFIKFVQLCARFPSLLKAVRKIDPEIIIFEGASWALYYVIVFILMKLSGLKGLFIYHAHNVEFLLRQEKNSRFIALLTKYAEKFLMLNADGCTAVSTTDAEVFRKEFGVNPILLPNGVDVARYASVKKPLVDLLRAKYHLPGKIILFMGLTTFKPNIQAIQFLVKNVFPKVHRIHPGTKLVIIGGHVPYRRPWLINPGSLPFEEVPTMIHAAAMCLSPIFIGSGTRLKILEYMAAGKAVISTKKGAEGLEVINGRDILFAEDEETFVNAILKLLKRPRLAKSLGKQGQAAVRSRYGWTTIAKEFSFRVQSMVH